mgnify:CR=1 FL=1
MAISQEQHAVYSLPDSIFTHIFQHLTFRELFQGVTLVCGWWRAILYKSITNIELVFVNKNVMFGPVPVNIDRIEQIVHLAKR